MPSYPADDILGGARAGGLPPCSPIPCHANGQASSLPIWCAPKVGEPVGSRVAERPDMREHLIAPVIPDWRGARRSCPDMWLLAGEDVSHHVACVLV